MYDALLESYELDPPLEDLVRVTNGLLAELLAVYHNVNFTDSNKEHLKLTGAAFLRDENAIDAEDADDESDGDEEKPAGDEMAIAAAMNPFGARVTGAGLVMGPGGKPPSAVLGAFFKGDQDG